MSDFLAQPLKVGKFELKHRIGLAPLTRVRATEETLAPNNLHVEYYSQRATDGGLLISEATIVAPSSIASRHIPGCFTEEQANNWKQVTDAVHAKGGIFSMQMWHQGRVSHASYKDHPLATGPTCISSSATPLDGVDVDYKTGEMVPRETPVEMSLDDIEAFKKQYVESTRLSLEVANCDLIELHCAHGYLFQQFFDDGVNKRTDQYGGSIENRVRLAREILELLVPKYPGRIAVRISPHTNTNGFFGSGTSNPEETYNGVCKMLSEFDLAYVLVTEPLWVHSFQGAPQNDPGAGMPLQNTKYLNILRQNGNRFPVFAAGGFTPQKAYKIFDPAVTPKEELYDGLCFGRYYISNPDLVFRFFNKLPFTIYNRKTFYVFPCKQAEDRKAYDLDLFPIGYTDYPTIQQQCEKYGFTVDEIKNDEAKQIELVEKSQADEYKLARVEDIGVYVNTAEREAAAAKKA